jgi:glutaredoxin
VAIPLLLGYYAYTQAAARPQAPPELRAVHPAPPAAIQFRGKEINVSGDHDARAWLVEATGRRTVPQIFIHGKSIGGFEELAALDRAGELQPLLAAG